MEQKHPPLKEDPLTQEEKQQLLDLMKKMLRPWNWWVILAGFRVGTLLDLIVMRSCKEPIEFPA